jgi:transposase
MGYALEHLEKQVEFWRSHMYSDGSTFDTSKRGSTWVTRLPTERYHNHCLQHSFHSGRGSLIVWGAISHNWKSPLAFLKGTGKKGVTSNDYVVQVLGPIVSSAFHGLLGYDDSTGGLFVEDQAPIHGTKKELVEAKKELGIPLHPRPSCSPDLNPIENVWQTMKSRIKARATFPDTIDKLQQAVQEEWDRLEPNDWNGFINSMPVRINQVKQRRGMQTEF